MKDYEARNKEKWRYKDPRAAHGLKRCSTCKQRKPRMEFAACRRNADGLQRRCNACRFARDQADPGARLLSSAKARAKKAGLPFDITRDDIRVPRLCPVLGIPLFKVPAKQVPNSPTLDRIINERGYVKGNVRVISWRANDLKKDATAGEIEAIIKYMEAQTRE